MLATFVKVSPSREKDGVGIAKPCSYGNDCLSTSSFVLVPSCTVELVSPYLNAYVQRPNTEWEIAFFPFTIIPNWPEGGVQSNSETWVNIWIICGNYNKALCLHMTKEPRKLLQAIILYKLAWALASHTDEDVRGRLWILHMAIFQNIADCYLQLGFLDESYKWLSFFKLTAHAIRIARQQPGNRLTTSAFMFFNLAAQLLLRRIAADAA